MSWMKINKIHTKRSFKSIKFGHFFDFVTLLLSKTSWISDSSKEILLLGAFKLLEEGVIGLDKGVFWIDKLASERDKPRRSFFCFSLTDNGINNDEEG